MLIGLYVLACLVVILLILIAWSFSRFKQLKEQYEHGLKTQRATLSGKVFQMYCPLAFKYVNEYDLMDIVAVFSTFDFLVLKGRNKGEIKEVEFQEMKTGHARLSDLQRSLRNTIKAGKVKFTQWRLSEKTGKWYKVREVTTQDGK